MKSIFVFVFVLTSSIAQAKLLDKIVAVINDKIITHSQVVRMKKTLEARMNISPQIYHSKNLDLNQLSEISVNRFMIRNKLGDMGYIISDDQVEEQIKGTEERLQLNRQALLNFLKENGITFDEYFEIIRETIEYNIFASRVIAPLISITDQEIKNEFYKKNSNDKSIAFKYELVSFSLPLKNSSAKFKKEFKDAMTDFRKNGVLPQQFSNVDTTVIGEISEDGLAPLLKAALKNTEEEHFTDAIDFNGKLTTFFVKKKDLVESEAFLRAKDYIREGLAQKQATSVANLWFQREKNLHYVKFF